MALMIGTDTTRDELLTALRYMTDRAKTYSRLGRKGTDADAYADTHETINDLLERLTGGE